MLKQLPHIYVINGGPGEQAHPRSSTKMRVQTEQTKCLVTILFRWFPHRRVTIAQTSLRVRAVSSEALLLAYTQYGREEMQLIPSLAGYVSMGLNEALKGSPRIPYPFNYFENDPKSLK